MRHRSARTPRGDLAALERAAAGVESLDELAGAPLSRLTAAVRSSNSMLFQFEAGGPRILGGALRDAMSSYREEYFAHDEIQKAGFRNPLVPTPLILNEWSELSWSTHRKSLAYADFYRRSDVEWMLCVHLGEEAHGAPGHTGIVLARAPDEPPFGEEELRVAAYAAQSLRVAMQRARRFASLELEAAGARAILAERAVLTVARDGRVVWLSAQAETVAAPFLAPSGHVRDPLLGLVQKFLADMDRCGEDLGLKVRARLSSEPQIDAELWLTRSNAGNELVGVELHGGAFPLAEDAASRLSARYGLTAAERRVLVLLGDAMTNREIAGRLCCSLETVRTHVAHLLGKLGTRSRVDAALLLTREAQRN
jgi:DNA-binding CsgD family transcriptional regulator